jgi:uncharacterized protein YndB with AHSA1/START domain
MSHYDWSKFLLRVDVRATPGAVYNAWATQSNLESWFLRKALFTTPDGKIREENDAVQPGDTYLWRWHGYDDKTQEKGKILDLNGKDLFKFTFAGTCEVTVTCKLQEGRTIMELVQEKIPTDEISKVRLHLGCNNGWTFYMANLKSIMEGGLDLRNKNVNIKKVVTS